MKSILLLGGGGHCKSILDSLNKLNHYDRIGLIINENIALASQKVPIVGCDEDLKKLFDEGWDSAFISVGGIGNTKIREKLYSYIINIGFNVPSIVDPSAVIASNVQIASGCYIGKNAIVNADSCISECAIINTGAIIEHDCEIGKFSHIAPGAVLCGNVMVGFGTHIGARAVVKQGLKIGNRALIGMGSVVTHEIIDNIKAYGVPCREIKE